MVICSSVPDREPPPETVLIINHSDSRPMPCLRKKIKYSLEELQLISLIAVRPTRRSLRYRPIGIRMARSSRGSRMAPSFDSPADFISVTDLAQDHRSWFVCPQRVTLTALCDAYPVSMRPGDDIQATIGANPARTLLVAGCRHVSCTGFKPKQGNRSLGTPRRCSAARYF